MGKKRRLSSTDNKTVDTPTTIGESLFREAMTEVTQLPKQNRVAAAPVARSTNKPRPKPAAANKPTTHSGEPQPLVEQWLRSGQSPAIAKPLRGDDFHIDGQLDLHHLKADEARRQLRRFLDQADRDHCRRLRIVHGRGLHSTGRAVLPELVQDELRLDPRVIAFRLAGRFDGGAGAVRVLFKPGR